MTAPMNPADVPHELIEAFERAALMSILHEDVRPSRYILAAVIPAIRAQVADEILATIGGYPGNEVTRPKVEVGRYMNDAEWAAAIARGDQ